MKTRPWSVADSILLRALTLVYSFGPPLVRTEALAYRAIAHVQRLAGPLVADDKRVHFRNKAWEMQKDMTPGRLHETYQKLNMLGSHSSRRPLKTVKLEKGELTTTEPQRQQ